MGELAGFTTFALAVGTAAVFGIAGAAAQLGAFRLLGLVGARDRR